MDRELPCLQQLMPARSAAKARVSMGWQLFFIKVMAQMDGAWGGDQRGGYFRWEGWKWQEENGRELGMGEDTCACDLGSHPPPCNPLEMNDSHTLGWFISSFFPLC